MRNQLTLALTALLLASSVVYFNTKVQQLPKNDSILTGSRLLKKSNLWNIPNLGIEKKVEVPCTGATQELINITGGLLPAFIARSLVQKALASGKASISNFGRSVEITVLEGDICEIVARA